MLIQQFPSGPLQTNAYVAADSTTKKAAIIDPAPESSHAIISYLLEHALKPEAILITHSHWDHIADTTRLKKKFKIPVFIHSLDVENLENPGSDGLPLFFEIEGISPDKILQEGEEIEIGELKFEVIHTPGHTPGGVCFYLQKQKVLFSGDTLFRGSIGNLSFPTSNAEEMWKSLKKLAKMPLETSVYPGHGPSTVLKNEPWLDNAEKFFG